MAAKITANATELREFVERLDKGETVSGIARAMGKPRPTMNNWKNAYESGVLVVDGKAVIWDGLPVSGSESLDRSPQCVAELRKENTELKAKVEKLLASVENHRRSKVKYSGKRKRRKKNSYKRVVIPDSHGCKADASAVNAFLADLEQLDNVQEVVFLGDHLDCDGFLTTHQNQYIGQYEYSFEEDVDAANAFIDEVQKRTQGAKYYFLEGNHEWRIERWICDQVKTSAKDARYLYKLMGPEAVMNLSERGIPFFNQGGYHMNIKTRGFIKLGECYFTHGMSTNGRHASYKNLHKYASCVVHGHNHTEMQAGTRFVEGQRVAAWCPGCLCEPGPMYRHSNSSNATHGYGLQFVNQDGTFHHINVPLVDGRSFLGDLN